IRDGKAGKGKLVRDADPTCLGHGRTSNIQHRTFNIEVNRGPSPRLPTGRDFASLSLWSPGLPGEGVGCDVMAFAITVRREFSAAHQLRLYDGSMEPLHGHNWRVKVVVQSEGLDGIGVVMDFHEVERMVDAIVGPWHNRN